MLIWLNTVCSTLCFIMFICPFMGPLIWTNKILYLIVVFIFDSFNWLKTGWHSITHRRLGRVKNILAMYLKYYKAGLTPTTPVTSTAISPVKMSIRHKSLTNLCSEMIFLQGKPVFFYNNNGMTLLGFKTILHKKCMSGKNSEGPAENSWVLE